MQALADQGQTRLDICDCVAQILRDPHGCYVRSNVSGNGRPKAPFWLETNYPISTRAAVASAALAGLSAIVKDLAVVDDIDKPVAVHVGKISEGLILGLTVGDPFTRIALDPSDEPNEKSDTPLIVPQRFGFNDG